MLDVDLRSVLKCVRCGACRSVCPVLEEVGWESKQMCPAGANPISVIENTRHRLVMNGNMTEAQAKLHERITGTGNSLGEVSDRRAWLGKYAGSIKETAEYVYFVGCLGAYRYPESLIAIFDVLSHFDVTIMPDDCAQFGTDSEGGSAYYHHELCRMSQYPDRELF
jgi:Fe-S oxidoreductase